MTPQLEWAMIIDTESAWQGWLDHGVFDFGDDPEVEVLIPARTDDLRWTNHARWEPFNDVLHRARAAPHCDWPFATLEEDGNEAQIGSRDEHGYVVLDPPLVALAANEMPPSALDGDVGLLFGVLGREKHLFGLGAVVVGAMQRQGRLVVSGPAQQDRVRVGGIVAGGSSGRRRPSRPLRVWSHPAHRTYPADAARSRHDR